MQVPQCCASVSVIVRDVKVRPILAEAMRTVRTIGLGRGAAWAWLAVLAALGRSTAYTDTEDFLSDLDKPGESNKSDLHYILTLGSDTVTTQAKPDLLLGCHE